MKRRILSILTALALVLSLCPVAALAAEGDVLAGDTLTDNPRDNTIKYVAGIVESNKGKILTVDKSGVVKINETSSGAHNGFIELNRGTVGRNFGQINGNYGIISSNAEKGEVRNNLRGGTIETNQGAVVSNEGLVGENVPAVMDGYVAVVYNKMGGIVESNSALVSNIGTVTTNGNGGVVYNYSNGSVETNQTGGTVYNFEAGASVGTNAGEVYWAVNDIDGTNPEKASFSAVTTENRREFIQEGCTVMAAEGYYFSAPPAAENADVVLEGGAYTIKNIKDAPVTLTVTTASIADAVAQVGDDYYTTVQAAFDAAAQIEGGGTVTLLKDVTVDQPITLSEGEVILTGGEEYTLTGTGSATISVTGGSLTLEDVTVKNTSEGQVLTPEYVIPGTAIHVEGSGNLTVSDGSAVRAEGKDGWALFYSGGQAHITIEGGTISGGEGFGFNTTGDFSADKISLLGGTFIGRTGSAVRVPSSFALGDLVGDGLALINDVTGEAVARTEQYTGSGTFTVQECHHKGAPATPNNDGTHSVQCPYCGSTGTSVACTYEFGTNVTGTCTVCGATGGTAVAQVTIGETTTYYGDILSAWNVVDGKTAALKLLESADLGSDSLELTSGDVTLEMAEGVTLTGSNSQGNAVVYVNNGTLTLKSGTVKNTFTGGGIGLQASGGVLEITGGTVESNIAVLVVGGTTYVTGGIFTGTGDHGVGLQKGGPWDSTVQISGGTFTGENGVYIASNSSSTLADLLAEDYAFKQDNAWVDTSGKSLTGTVTVAPAPVKITEQPKNATATYGGYPVLQLAADPLVDGTLYQWYQVVEGGEDSAIPNDNENGGSTYRCTPRGLAAGTYQFYCMVSYSTYKVKSNSVTVTVEKKSLNPSIEGTATKTYDGTTDAPADLSIKLEGIVGEDVVSAKAESYAYNSPNVNDARTITATGITLSGEDAGNYKLSATTATTTGTITKDTSAAVPTDGEGYKLDYVRETISVIAGYEVSTTTVENGEAVKDGNISSHLGKTLYIRKTEDDNHAASGWTAFTLAPRPAAPELTLTGETILGKADGKLTVADGQEYKLGDGSWTAGPATVETLAGGTDVAVRVKATDTAPHGEEATGTVAAGAPITVTFDSQGGSSVEALTGLSYGTPVSKPTDPAREDYEFQGWYTEAAGTTAWKFDVDTVTEDTTLYAQWKKVYFAVSGTVFDYEGKKGISDATVMLMKGSTEIDQSTTRSDGTFTFNKHIPAGAYNVITTYTPQGKDQQTKTTLVTITNADAEVKINLPPEGANSQLNVSKNSDTPAVVVGGLDDEAAEMKKDATVQKVTISMAIESKSESSATGSDQIKELAEKEPEQTPPPEGKVRTVKLEFLDISITATITKTNSSEASTEEVKEAKTVMELVVPFDFSNGTEIKVYRYHDGLAEALKRLGGQRATKEDGCYSLDTENGLIHIYARKFSTYAISYAVEEDQPETPVTPTPTPGDGWISSTYAVTVEKSEHGKVTSSRTNAGSGSTVTLTVAPDSGYVLDTLTVTDSRGGEIKLTAQGNGKYTFTMPGRAVTVKAAFAPLPNGTACDGGENCPSHGFTDLGSAGTWYHEAVDYVLQNNLMGGYGNGKFGPNDNLTRAQFAQILFNQEGRPVVNYLLRYSDVADGAWYTEAVRWATSQGIVGGYGNGRFGPNDKITREQLAVMLWRYAGSPAATDKELHFADADEASGYALEALRWAVENGILNGYGDGRLDPKGLATRAQVAQMFMNFMESQEEAED